MIKTILSLLFLSSISFAQSSDEIKNAADRAVTWLVSQQRPDGSYGDSAQTTAKTLYAMAVCPRKYREDDGPFMRRGVEYLLINITKNQGNPEAVASITGALKALNSKKFAKDISALEELAKAAKLSHDPLAPIANADMAEILKTQASDGSWNSSVDESASRLITISLYKPAPPKLMALEEAQQKGVKYLLAQRQGKVWGFPGKPDAGITALSVSALLASPRTPDSEKAIQEGLDYLVSIAKPDGSIYEKGYANYTTCSAVMALVASGKPEYKPLIEKAQKYLIALQADEDRGYQTQDKFYGGIGYGGSQRSDLSNLQFALEALDATGLPKDHELYKKTLIFMTRSQNHSETNDFTVDVDGVNYVPGNDGGAAYYPGNSMAGYDTLPNGSKVPRSYGSMSYALLRGYLFAGVPKEDSRLQALVKWIEKNFTLTENPGFDKKEGPAAAMQGYFYYLLTMSKALEALGSENIKTPDGVTHAWRKELRDRLISMQKADGSWVNEQASRWYEGNPVLATAYALATLGN